MFIPINGRFAMRIGAAAAIAASILAAPSPASASVQNITCLQALDVTVSGFSDGAGSVHGTVTLTNCVSVTNPTIVGGSAVIAGSATGTPADVTLHETQTITWRASNGSQVALSVVNSTRRLFGPANAMVEVGTTAHIVEGLFEGASQTVAAGIATRTQHDGDWQYTNDGGCDYG